MAKPLSRPLHLLTVSMGGTAIALGAVKLALPTSVALAGGGPGEVATVTVALTLAWPLFGLFSGLLFDRHSRVGLVSLMQLGFLATIAVTLLSLELSWTHVVLLAALGFLVGCWDVLADTASQILVPEIAAGHDPGAANGWVQGARSVGITLVGPALGTALLGWHAAAPYAAAALALFLALAATRCLPRRPAPTGDGARGLTAAVDGVRTIFRTPPLRGMTLLLTGMILGWAAWPTLMVSYAVDPAGLGLAADGLSLILVALGCGSLVGALSAATLRRRLGERSCLMLDPAGIVIFLAVPALGGGPWLIGLSAFVAGFGAIVWSVVVAGYFQATVPAQRLGRVATAYRWIGWAAYPAGAALTGVVGEWLGYRPTFGLFAGWAAIVLGSFFWLLPRMDGRTVQSGAVTAEGS
jgi:predicted MFS family arabinose efflux permease